MYIFQHIPLNEELKGSKFQEFLKKNQVQINGSNLLNTL